VASLSLKPAGAPSLVVSGASHDPYPLCQGGEARCGSAFDDPAALGAAPPALVADTEDGDGDEDAVLEGGAASATEAAGVDGARAQLAHHTAPKINASPPALRTALANLSSPTPGLYPSLA